MNALENYFIGLENELGADYTGTARALNHWWFDNYDNNIWFPVVKTFKDSLLVTLVKTLKSTKVKTLQVMFIVSGLLIDMFSDCYQK